MIEKQKIMQELKEAIEQSNANQKRRILYMAKLIYKYREDSNRDEKLEEALKNYLEE